MQKQGLKPEGARRCRWLDAEHESPAPQGGRPNDNYVDKHRLIARLGGFLARKGDWETGVKIIWLGLQRVVDFAAGIRFAREHQELD